MLKSHLKEDPDLDEISMASIESERPDLEKIMGQSGHLKEAEELESMFKHMKENLSVRDAHRIDEASNCDPEELRKRLEDDDMNASFTSELSASSAVKAKPLPIKASSNIYKPPAIGGPKVGYVETNTSEESMTVINNIEQRIAEFHKMKESALADCESAFDELQSVRGEDGEKLLELPDDFLEDAEFQAEEVRQQEEEFLAIQDEPGFDQLDEEGKRLVLKFANPDLAPPDELPMHEKLQGIMGNEKQKEKSEKVQRELEKIRTNDKLLVETNKVYKESKQNAQTRKQELIEREYAEKKEMKREFEDRKKKYIRTQSLKSAKSKGSGRVGSRGSQRSKKGLGNPFA